MPKHNFHMWTSLVQKREFLVNGLSKSLLVHCPVLISFVAALAPFFHDKVFLFATPMIQRGDVMAPCFLSDLAMQWHCQAKQRRGQASCSQLWIKENNSGLFCTVSHQNFHQSREGRSLQSGIFHGNHHGFSPNKLCKYWLFSVIYSASIRHGEGKEAIYIIYLSHFFSSLHKGFLKWISSVVSTKAIKKPIKPISVYLFPNIEEQQTITRAANIWIEVWYSYLQTI